MRRAGLVMLAVLVVAGCGRAAVPLPPNSGRCISMVDSIKTLRKGDELPRVVQVLGMPARGYRVFSPFGRIHDVLEYDVAPSACFKGMLGADNVVHVVFDGKGEYMGAGEVAYKKVRRVSMVRVEPMVLDPVVLLP